MSRNRETPEQRYRCSVLGCSCAQTFAAGTYTRRVAVGRLKHEGWAIFDGEAICPSHNTDALVRALSASLPMAVARRFRDSDNDDARERAGGSMAALAAGMGGRR